MPPFRNLVSDSTLVQETIDHLRDCGGRAAATEIADSVFKISHLDAELASLLVADLVRDDHRFKVFDGQTVELLTTNVETQPIEDLDFVVVDVEATGAKTPPNRLIELGAYRVREGRIVDEFVTLVNPELPIPRFVASLTRITNEMVKDAPVFAEVAPRWLEFVSDAVLVERQVRGRQQSPHSTGVSSAGHNHFRHRKPARIQGFLRVHAKLPARLRPPSPASGAHAHHPVPTRPRRAARSRALAR